MRKPIVVALMLVAVLGALALFSPTPAIAAANCDAVRCMACPAGYHVSLKWPNCCRCIKN
jgi:biotin-(acetyl-CoA carboxylase) ligase